MQLAKKPRCLCMHAFSGHAKEQGESVVVTNARHYHYLQEVYKSLTDVTEGLENLIPGDLLALDIRRCLHYLGMITGEVSNDDLLDYVFSEFCIEHNNLIQKGRSRNRTDLLKAIMYGRLNLRSLEVTIMT